MLVKTGHRELVQISFVESIADPELKAPPFDRRVLVRINQDASIDIVGAGFGAWDTVRRDIWGENLLG